MPQSRDTNPFLRGASQKPSQREWYRIENAHKDEDNATDEVTSVYIFGDIGESWWGDGTSANDFVKLLSGIKSNKIALHINSPGGSAFDGIAIYQALVDHSAEIEVHVDALAASAASVIAMAGDTVYMTEAAMLMIHDASMGAYGNADYLRENADVLDKLSDAVSKLYARKAGEDASFWRKIMKQEMWYTSDEAKAAGLVDEIKGETKDEDLEDAKNRWNMSMYHYKNRDEAPDPLEFARKVLNTLGDQQVSSAPAESEPNQPVEPAQPNTTEPVEPAPEEQPDNAPEGTPAEPVTPTPTVPPENKATMSNGVPTFFVNGQPTSDIAAVQQQLNMLEQFRNETMTAARDSFVDQLAADNKILQPQVAGMKTFAQSLDESAYVAWCATWDGAAAQPLFAVQPGGGGTQPTQSSEDRVPGQAPASTATDLEVAMDIVKQHKIGGMKQQALESTPSFQKLKAADPSFSFDKI